MVQQKGAQVGGVLFAFTEFDEQSFEVGGERMRTRARRRMQGVVFGNAGPVQVGKKGAIAENDRVKVL